MWEHLKRLVGEKRPDTFCMAPWTHTYISPQAERRLCCASREEAKYVKQYIDRSTEGSAEFSPTTLEEHWNSDHMKSVRRRMLQGERLPECEVCNEQTLNLFTYRKYFTERLFPHLWQEVLASTAADGSTTMRPISFDYRLSNQCNFKCRMCGEQLSSSWEAEKRKYNVWSDADAHWMRPEIKREMQKFQKEVVEAEFAAAVRENRVEEIYWVGGEPLMWLAHWQYMQEIRDRGYAKDVFVRYNTNLSKIEHRGVELFSDLLVHFKDFNLCASIDAVGKTGEFIRTGIDWQKWRSNYERACEFRAGKEDRVVMDVTLTLPGLIHVEELLDYANATDSKLYVKLVYAFDPTIMLSPFALPREVLDPLIDRILNRIRPKISERTQALFDTIQEIKARPTFSEQFPDWEAGFAEGRRRLERLADWRGDGIEGRVRLEDIYAAEPDVLAWWNQENKN